MTLHAGLMLGALRLADARHGLGSATLTMFHPGTGPVENRKVESLSKKDERLSAAGRV